MEHVNQMLAVCQLGITVCSLLILNISEPAIHHLLYGPLTQIGIPEAVSSTVAFIAALIMVTFLHVTFGEMVPKNFSVSLADRMVLLLAPPLVFLDKVFYPVVKVLNSMANSLLKLFGVQPQNELSSAYTLEEVQQIVAESTKSGLVEDDSGLLSGALEFSDYQAAAVMVPIDQVVSLEEGVITPREFEKVVGRTGFSRFAMVDQKGRFTGYLHLKDVLDIEHYDEPIPITKTPLANVGATARSRTPWRSCKDPLRTSRGHLINPVRPWACCSWKTRGACWGDPRRHAQARGQDAKNMHESNKNNSHL